MTDGQQLLVPAGWHPDPTDRSKLRWWDGAAWTSHVVDPPPVVAIPAPPAMLNPAGAQIQSEPTYAPYTQNRAERGGAQAAPTAGAQTLPVWLIVFSPLWAGALSGVSQYLLSSRAPLIAAPLAVIVAAAALFGLAWVDRARLRNRGHSRAPHPTWVLLSPLAYLIARIVRVGGRSVAPLVTYVLVLVLIAVIAVSLVLLYASSATTGVPV